MKKTILLFMCVIAGFLANAQRGYRDSNRIGIAAGINQFTLNTDSFDAKPGMGWNAGLSIRGNFYNDFDMVFGMQFSENNFSVQTTTPTAFSEDVDYKLPSAQIMLLLSYKILENHLSVELGPMFQINGKLTLDEENELNIINGTTLFAKDITEISKFSFYPTIGITGGIRHLRASVMYQYGVNNIFGGLNTGAGNEIKAHAGILTGNIIVYL